MKIKKYIARTMPEAMNEIRKELGADAVILNSKEIKSGGFLGLFQKKNIEVIAALDNEVLSPKRENKIDEKRNERVLQHVSKNRFDQTEVLDEIKHLKQLLATQSFQSEHDFPALFENMYKYLLEQEVDQQLAKDMITTTLSNTENENSVGKNELKQIVKREIKKRLDHLSFQGISSENQIIQFVGPTGVGKTTTLAKVAALTMLEDKKKIAFITTDTYRIAAIEQLKTYARILDVPVEVAYSLKDYKNALEKFSSYDFIFVDTAGRNFRDERYIKELKNIIDFDKFKVETYLVLSLTAKAQDITDIYEQFEHVSVKKLIFTKIDETLTYGSILNISTEKAIDIAYFTNGQDVPDDLIKPNKEVISDLILRRYADA